MFKKTFISQCTSYTSSLYYIVTGIMYSSPCSPFSPSLLRGTVCIYLQILLHTSSFIWISKYQSKKINNHKSFYNITSPMWQHANRIITKTAEHTWPTPARCYKQRFWLYFFLNMFWWGENVIQTSDPVLDKPIWIPSPKHWKGLTLFNPIPEDDPFVVSNSI